MSGNTSDEFSSYIEASSKEDLKKKAEEIFGKNAETLLRFPEAMRENSDGKYAKVNGIECTIKCLFSDKKSAGEKKPYYYYRFDPDIPGWDNAGTFHSVDLWFFFETLAKCWRPFVGQHYDLSRMMCNYWVNFIKTGDPNGNDADGKPMPYWYPYEKEKPCEMIFMSDRPVVTTNGKFLNLCAIGNPKLVTEKQIAVTYKATKKELLSAPESQLDKLPKLSAKLEVGEPVKIVLYGDSVCCGCDCNGMYGQKPGQPTWAHQEEYSESLKGLEGMGVAIADIQAVQKEIGKRKRYIDITGNWLNHPNDYLARILAQVVIKTLGM